MRNRKCKRKRFYPYTTDYKHSTLRQKVEGNRQKKALGWLSSVAIQRDNNLKRKKKKTTSNEQTATKLAYHLFT